MTVVRFEPRGAVLDLFKNKDREVLLSGAAGTGKTVGALMKLHLACLQVPNVRALIVRKTHVSLTGSTLVTYRTKVAREALEAGLVSYFGGSPQEPASYRYINGSIIVVGGLDRASRLLSTEYDLVLVDEAIETVPEDIDTIVTRLRNGRLSYQQLIMATNPGQPTHHLKQRVDAKRCTILYSKHEDNPRMHRDGEWTKYGSDYIERLDSLVGARYERMRWGKWVSAEGIVYEDFDPALHLLDQFDIPPQWPRYWAVDFGYTNPFVCQMWAQDPDGRLYLYKEIYHTQMTVDEHAARIAKVVIRAPRHVDGRWNGEWKEPRPRAVICDHDAEGRVVFERHLGLATRNAHKAVTEGIQAVQKRLRVAGDGKPRIFLMRDALVKRDPKLNNDKHPMCTIDEITGYIWDTAQGERLKEAPRKLDDHGMDAMRYLVADLDLRAKPRFRSFNY